MFERISTQENIIFKLPSNSEAETGSPAQIYGHTTFYYVLIPIILIILLQYCYHRWGSLWRSIHSQSVSDSHTEGVTYPSEVCHTNLKRVRVRS